MNKQKCRSSDQKNSSQVPPQHSDFFTPQNGIQGNIKSSYWKKSYDKHRQHIKKQRHYFTDKDLYSQSFGFSSSHVWM